MDGCQGNNWPMEQHGCILESTRIRCWQCYSVVRGRSQGQTKKIVWHIYSTHQHHTTENGHIFLRHAGSLPFTNSLKLVGFNNWLTHSNGWVGNTSKGRLAWVLHRHISNYHKLGSLPNSTFHVKGSTDTEPGANDWCVLPLPGNRGHLELNLVVAGHVGCLPLPSPQGTQCSTGNSTHPLTGYCTDLQFTYIQRSECLVHWLVSLSTCITNYRSPRTRLLIRHTYHSQ